MNDLLSNGWLGLGAGLFGIVFALLLKFWPRKSSTGSLEVDRLVAKDAKKTQEVAAKKGIEAIVSKAAEEAKSPPPQAGTTIDRFRAYGKDWDDAQRKRNK